MREVQFLSADHVASLERLLALQSDPQNDMVRRNLPFYLQNNGQAMAVGVTVDRTGVEQALLTFFQRPNANHDYVAVTTAITGVGTFVAETFDMLCAACSSATPTVCLHVLIYAKSMGPTIKQAWQLSRLGRYTVKGRELTTDEALDLLGPIIQLNSIHRVHLFAIEYPAVDGNSLQPEPKRNTIRCKYC